jgi:hypothetical protein
MNNILPNGTEIRDLLTESFLTTTQINGLLKDKGIITQNSDKNVMFPIYMSLLLSPVEFNYLYEKNMDKEEKEKVKTIVFPINENLELADVCLDLNIHEILIDKLTYRPNYEVLGNPNLVINNDEINFELRLKSTSNIKGWSSRESHHSASFNIKKENDKLIVTKTFTSKDSERVIDFALENYEEKLGANNFIKKDKKVERILFGDFTNENRFAYFYSFAQDFKNVLQFEEITDINILPDYEETSVLPQTLKDFLNNVNDISLKGKKLQDHIFITEKENHNFIQLKSIKFKYKFDKLGYDGNCIVEFEFPDKKNMNISEFQFNISSLSIDRKDKEFVTNSVASKKINSVFNKHKLEKYEIFKTEEVVVVM